MSMEQAALQAEEKGVTLKSMQKHLVNLIVSCLVSGIISWVVFYFNTTYTIKDHSKQIEQIHNELVVLKAAVDNINIKPIQIEAKIGGLIEQIEELKNGQTQTTASIKQISDRTDKIYEVIISLKNR
jgi:hypothetical protein